MKTDSILFGALLGLVIPVVGYALMLTLNQALVDAEIALSNGDNFQGIRTSFWGIIAIAFNLIPFNIFRKRYMDKSLRGIVFPTIFYAILWVIYFKGMYPE